MKFETVIGLEVHAQLKTQAKLFSTASTRYGQNPNTQTTFLDAAYPGTLPVLNQEALRMAIQFGLSIDATLDDQCCFDRKNYFYPDLPKGYQITQFHRPIIKDGYLSVSLSDHELKKVHIAYAHLEEDAGKSNHQIIPGFSGIDLNRAGVPLLEIVTSPCLYSAQEAVAYLKTLHQHLLFLKICDGNMQEGSFRCDVNLSLRPAGETTLGTRTELKNINSFRFIEKAIALEEERHRALITAGLPIVQETRGYSPDTDTTYVLREKESHADYRYAPDPDLRPIPVTETLVKDIQSKLLPNPSIIKENLRQDNLSIDHLDFLMTSPDHHGFYISIKKHLKTDASMIVNFLKGPFSAVLNQTGTTFEHPPITSEEITELLKALQTHHLSLTRAKQILNLAITEHVSIRELIQNEPTQTTCHDLDLDALIIKTLQEHPQQTADYQAGKTKLLSFFMGLIMKTLQGKTDPTLLAQAIQKHLS